MQRWMPAPNSRWPPRVWPSEPTHSSTSAPLGIGISAMVTAAVVVRRAVGTGNRGAYELWMRGRGLAARTISETV